MSKRSIAWRRHHSQRIQKKRFKSHSSSASEFSSQWLSVPKNLGKLKKNHFGCGCRLCKPWKHGLDGPSHSEKKRLD